MNLSSFSKWGLRGVLGFLAVLLVLGFLPTSATAQTQLGTVTGRVADISQASVPQVKVTLRNTGTNTKMETSTNNDGLYVFAEVPSGNYEITLEKEGFRKVTQAFTLEVAQTAALNFTMEVGAITETISVSAATEVINTSDAELSTTISTKELDTLPLATRNPYTLIGLAAGVAYTGSVTGDTRGGLNNAMGTGGGFAVNGGRTSDLNYTLDGGENNDTFIAGIGQTVPLDAVQELKVQTTDMSAVYGRNPIGVNVTTKSGTNSFHGSAYEFYRGSGISSAPFQDNATNSKSSYVRNQFGGSFGGPIRKDKTFFFGSFEGNRIRGTGSTGWFVPTQDWVNNAAPNAAAFTTGFGPLPASNCAEGAITADQILAIEGSTTPLVNPNTSLPIPGSTKLFCHTTLRFPIDNGGGLPGDTWLFTTRVDHHFSDRTILFGRYAFSNTKNPNGTVSFSPFQGFNTGQRTRDQNANATLTHVFSPTLTSELRLIYNRVFLDQPEAGPGQAPTTTPCWQYGFFTSTPNGDEITFPGYSPTVCSFAGIPFGGPQNIYQVHGDMTYLKGKHTLKWGGGYVHMRDNRTFGAYENGFFSSCTMQDMLNGTVDVIEQAIDPRGHVPRDRYDPAVLGPLQFPSFTRHFHYNEVGVYGEDSFKMLPRLTVTLGLRWEYFGVEHSPTKERALDANFLLGAVGDATDTNLFHQIENGRFQRVNNLYQQDWNDFGPRAGAAWDIFGTGRTVLRAGYGVFYDRNFGNATFNVIQNPPNYNVEVTGGLPIELNELDTLNAGGPFRLGGSARMLDKQLRTAYSQQWNATVEHNILGKGVIASVSYVGSNGIGLYSLNNINQRGSCLLDPGLYPAPIGNGTCDPGGGVSVPSRMSRLNQTGLTGTNRRGNEGLSRYHGLQFDVHTPQLGHTGLTFRGTYTWSHSMDNESSFFSDSSFEGCFGFGFNDPFNPAGSRASSTNDIRHRGTVAWSWAFPWGSHMSGIGRQVFGGWTWAGVFAAQTGGAFSVYDGSPATDASGNALNQCANSVTNFCYPVLTGAVPSATQTAVPGQANTFNLYSIPATGTFQTQNDFCAANPTAFSSNPAVAASSDPGLACTAALINLDAGILSPRNLFRLPGIWNVDTGVYKDFAIPWREGMKLQLRGEFFNVFNHSNLYAVANTNVFTPGSDRVTGGSDVKAKRGCFPSSSPCIGGKERRNVQVALRFIF